MFSRIEDILETAERVGEEIRHEAESDAMAQFERSRREAELLVSEQLARTRRLVRTLRAQLRDLADEAEAIERSFEDAVASRPDMTRRADTHRGAASEFPSPAPVGYPGTGRQMAEPQTAESNGEPDRAPRNPLRQAALTRGTELAVAGQSRERIEASLRSEFRLEDASSLVDEILARR